MVHDIRTENERELDDGTRIEVIEEVPLFAEPGVKNGPDYGLPKVNTSTPMPVCKPARNSLETKATNPKDLIGQTKLQTWLAPRPAMIALVEALTDGANKYGPYNWREKGVRATVYISAAERHLMAYLDGENVAEDSGVHHLGHAMACFAILLDAIAQGNIVDDRPIKGASPALLKAIHLKNEEKNKAK